MMASRLRPIPAFTIWLIRSSPEANTIALGGVATGNMKAQLEASPAGITTSQTSDGSGEKVAAAAARIGSVSEAAAVLLAFIFFTG